MSVCFFIGMASLVMANPRELRVIQFATFAGPTIDELVSARSDKLKFIRLSPGIFLPPAHIRARDGPMTRKLRVTEPRHPHPRLFWSRPEVTIPGADP